MGISSSSLPKDLGGVHRDERFWGLENFGNTCYINSVLQALFFCKSFRTRLIKYADDLPHDIEDGDLVFAVANLFKDILAQPKQSGSIAPRHLVQVVQRFNPEFHSPAHQDAQEFLSFLLNHLGETMARLNADVEPPASPSTHSAATPCQESSQSPQTTPVQSSGCGDSGSSGSKATPTLIEDVFVGRTVNNTRCMNCEKVSRKLQDFKEFEVSVKLPDVTLERCMLSNSKKELMQADNKLLCGGCNSYAECYKWVEIESFPPVLLIHFKRFEYSPVQDLSSKLRQRIAFDNRFTPPREVHSLEGEDIVYDLSAVVVHVGSSLENGHYITYVRHAETWFCFDDKSVQLSSQREVEGCFGDAQWTFNNDMHAYLLFYQLVTPEGGAAAGSPGDGSTTSPTSCVA